MKKDGEPNTTALNSIEGTSLGSIPQISDYFNIKYVTLPHYHYAKANFITEVN
jgi:hypothetical protein